jgi:hypothetical protein
LNQAQVGCKIALTADRTVYFSPTQFVCKRKLESHLLQLRNIRRKENGVNVDILLDILKKEGELSKEELLKEARRRGIFKPHSALRYLEHDNFVQITEAEDGQTVVSYNHH